MNTQSLTWQLIGPLCFGVVMGWITYRTLRYTKTNGISDIASVVGAVGGAGVVTIIGKDPDAFPMYSIGLAIGFFAYAIVALRNPNVPWLGANPGGMQQNVVDPAGTPVR
jgi:hypothetical protein